MLKPEFYSYDAAKLNCIHKRKKHQTQPKKKKGPNQKEKENPTPQNNPTTKNQTNPNTETSLTSKIQILYFLACWLWNETLHTSLQK